MNEYIALITAEIDEVPCIVGVINYCVQEGSYSYNAPSDIDYYGYVESEWELLDKDGQYSKELNDNLTQSQVDYVETLIDDCMSKQYENDRYESTYNEEY
mgnify:FL=1